VVVGPGLFLVANTPVLRSHLLGQAYQSFREPRKAVRDAIRDATGARSRQYVTARARKAKREALVGMDKNARQRRARALYRARKAAVRTKCLECVCWQSPEVRRCHIYDCTLWPWRLGGLSTSERADGGPPEPQTAAEGPSTPGEDG